MRLKRCKSQLGFKKSAPHLNPAGHRCASPPGRRRCCLPGAASRSVFERGEGRQRRRGV